VSHAILGGWPAELCIAARPVGGEEGQAVAAGGPQPSLPVRQNEVRVPVKPRADPAAGSARSLLSHDGSRVLVLAKADKSGVSQMVVGGPLHELKLSHEHRREPLAHGHLRLREALAPPPAPRVRHVDEGAHVGDKGAELPEELRADGRREAVARPGDIDQVIALVVPEDECVEGAATARVAPRSRTPALGSRASSSTRLNAGLARTRCSGVWRTVPRSPAPSRAQSVRASRRRVTTRTGPARRASATPSARATPLRTANGSRITSRPASTITSKA
jgi:hypothetical protein